jgi:hypothetical protein
LSKPILRNGRKSPHFVYPAAKGDSTGLIRLFGVDDCTYAIQTGFLPFILEISKFNNHSESDIYFFAALLNGMLRWFNLLKQALFIYKISINIISENALIVIANEAIPPHMSSRAQSPFVQWQERRRSREIWPSRIIYDATSSFFPSPFLRIVISTEVRRRRTKPRNLAPN